MKRAVLIIEVESDLSLVKLKACAKTRLAKDVLVHQVQANRIQRKGKR